MSLMVTLHTDHIDWLMECRHKVKARDFSNFTVEQLLHEAIYEFKENYGKSWAQTK